MNNGRYAFAPLPPMPTGENQTQHAARMMEYMPGVLFRKATATTPDYYRPGIERTPSIFITTSQIFAAKTERPLWKFTTEYPARQSGKSQQDRMTF